MALVSRVFFKSCPLLASRSFHITHSMRDDTLKKLLFNLDGYNKYGLLHDDLLSDFLPEVEEAVRRLPEEEQMQRIYRAIRAQQAEVNHSILPKEQWTKFEDNHYYLQPYIDEIKKEEEERQEWEANH